MLYIGILLGWCLAGLLITYIVLITHVINAEKMGYKASEFLNDEGNVDMLRFILFSEDDTETRMELVLRCIINALIWPLLITWMRNELFPTLYLLYDRYEPEYESEEWI